MNQPLDEMGLFYWKLQNSLHIISGQIIATSHDRFPPNGGLVTEIPLFQGNLGWWNIIIWQDIWISFFSGNIAVASILWGSRSRDEDFVFTYVGTLWHWLLVRHTCYQYRHLAVIPMSCKGSHYARGNFLDCFSPNLYLEDKNPS